MSFFKRKESKERELGHGSPSASSPPTGVASTMPASIGQRVPSAQRPLDPREIRQEPKPERAIFPWMTRSLRLPVVANQANTPFPRYGLSLSPVATPSGHLLIFGGLVKEAASNDLYSIDTRDISALPVQTTGEIPMPRVGHKSALVSSVLIIWGGDTKTRLQDQQDEALYLLNIHTREWSRIIPEGLGPVGRYGHAVCMLGSKFFVFGGQSGDEFLNDLWAFDLNTLKEQPAWESIKPVNDPPPRRCAHIMVAYKDKLYMFGGTDGSYHYNDTWCFDLPTRTWTELSCIGYIPVTREGHAAALVDDVIYIFGGRDVNGMDLGDLAAFKISNQRWYMFQNMGPAPIARSGHAMGASGKLLYVLGGESNLVSDPAHPMPTPEDPSIIHVLDTSRIKYPPDANRPLGQQPIGRKTSTPTMNGQQHSPPKKPQTPVQQLASSQSQSSLNRELQQESEHPERSPEQRQTQEQRLVQEQRPGQEQEQRPVEPRSVERSPEARTDPTDRSMGPPQRPRRKGDDAYGIGDPDRAMSPNGRVGSPTRVTSPPPRFNPAAIAARSPSPRQTAPDERPAPPPDAFYYSRSPTANGFNRPGSVTGMQDLMRDLKAKETEVESIKRKEAALRVILGRAVSAGFTDVDLEGEDVPTPNGAVDGLLKLKQDMAQLQTELAEQVRHASVKQQEAERIRSGALQEAAFYRAKLATVESGSMADIGKIDKERIGDLEKQIHSLSTDHAAVQQKIATLEEATSHAESISHDATEREQETLQRAESAEAALARATEELDQIHNKHRTTEGSLREHTERLITLSSVAQQHEADRDLYRSQFEEASNTRDMHVGLVEETQAALVAAGQRTQEVEGLYEQARARINELEHELIDVRVDVDSRTREAELAKEKLAEVESAFARSREEADSLRVVTTGRLGELLDSHNNLRADDSRSTRGHTEKLRALDQEASSLRKMMREAGTRVDAAEAGAATHRQRVRELESQHASLRAELRSHRSKALAAQADVARHKELHSAKDAELRERDLAVSELEVRTGVLRNLLADHGIAIADDVSSEDPSRELEAKLKDRTRAHEASQREVEELSRRCREAEDKVESLGRLVETMKDGRSPTSASMRSPSPGTAGSDTDRKLAEAEAAHKEKLAQLESDYQTAVKYVKGTEKMLRRMKEELTRQKQTNATLQADLDGLRGISSTEAGSRTRESGRATPSSEGDLQRKLQTLTAQHAATQSELAAMRTVLTAREQELEISRAQTQEISREIEALRDELDEAHGRIAMLLDVDQSGMRYGDGKRPDSVVSSDEATMAFDKLTSELKQWERTRSPSGDKKHSEEYSHER